MSHLWWFETRNRSSSKYSWMLCLWINLKLPSGFRRSAIVGHLSRRIILHGFNWNVIAGPERRRSVVHPLVNFCSKFHPSNMVLAIIPLRRCEPCRDTLHHHRPFYFSWPLSESPGGLLSVNLLSMPSNSVVPPVMMLKSRYSTC